MANIFYGIVINDKCELDWSRYMVIYVFCVFDLVIAMLGEV